MQVKFHIFEEFSSFFTVSLSFGSKEVQIYIKCQEIAFEQSFKLYINWSTFFVSQTWNYKNVEFFFFFFFFLQISSIISGYRYFKQSDDGHLGIFKGVLELFRNILHTLSHNRCELSFAPVENIWFMIPVCTIIDVFDQASWNQNM